MPKINKTKFNYISLDELVTCPHCKHQNLYPVTFHFENRPKKKDGHVVIPLELIETKVYDVAPPQLCSVCNIIPKCKDCEILLCNWKRHTHSQSAKMNSRFCESCEESRICLNLPVIPTKTLAL